MKTVALAFLAVLVMAGMAYGSPYVVCDPQAGVQFYKITGWTPDTKTAEADGSVKLDVATASMGTTAMTFKACITDAAWGEVCSEATPFDLVRPGVAGKPVNIKLVP